MDFGSFLATGSVGAAFAPFVPGGSSTLQQNMRLNMDRDQLDHRRRLLNGLDDIGLTMEKKSSIDSYEAKAKAERAWA